MSQSIYQTPKVAPEPAHMVWPALGIFVFSTIGSLWLATQYVAYQLVYNPLLGQPMVGHLYNPFHVLAWIWKFQTPASGPAVNAVFEKAHLILGVGALVALLGPAIYAYIRTRRNNKIKIDLHGSAHWADSEEVAATKLLPDPKNAGGVMLGAYTDEKSKKTSYLRHAGPEHILVFAPTRSGKGVGIVIPTLLNWNESVLVHDLKGENWALTSGFREKSLGQRCIRFSPSETSSARFNPLHEIRLDQNMVRDVQNIATMIVDPDGKGMADHWAKTSFDLLTGVIVYVLLTDEIPQKDRNLSTVQAILSDGGPLREIAKRAAQANPVTAAAKSAAPAAQGFEAVMEIVRDQSLALASKLADSGGCQHKITGLNTAAQAAQSFLNKAANEGSGVLSTAMSFLALYRDPIVAANTQVSDFSIESLMQQKTSLYLVVPPSDKDRLKPLLRLILNQVVRRLTEGMDFDENGASHSRYPHKMLLLIDEFPSLGKLEVFEESLAFIAGYGLKAMLIAQDLSQLQKAYSRDESIVSNCHIRIAFAPNKVETAELLSKMIGQSTVTHAQRQYSGNRFAPLLQHVNTNEQIVQRPLLTADECMRLPETDEVVFVAGHAPIYCQKILYYKDPAMSQRQKMLGASFHPHSDGFGLNGPISAPLHTD